MHQRTTTILVFLALYTGTVFALWPGLDNAVSAFFYSDGMFFGRSAAGKVLRGFLHYLPIAVILAMIVTWIARRFGAAQSTLGKLGEYAPSNRGLFFALAALALGPGLIVNVILKDNWGRPRPVHVREFGGKAEFRPWWRTDGACRQNCSFVSGEVSGAFWLVAPASLAPPYIRGHAIAGALALGLLTAVGRLAFGGHFLSDVLFAALFTLLICQLLYLAIMPRGPPDEREED